MVVVHYFGLAAETLENFGTEKGSARNKRSEHSASHEHHLYVGYGVTANIAASHEELRGSSGFDSPYPNDLFFSIASFPSPIFDNPAPRFMNIPGGIGNSFGARWVT